MASRTAKHRVAALGCAWPGRDVPAARCLAFACRPCRGLHASPGLRGRPPGCALVSPRLCAPGHAGVAWRDLACSCSPHLQLEMESLRGPSAACAEWSKGVPFLGTNSIQKKNPRRAQRAAAARRRPSPSLRLSRRGLLTRRGWRSSDWSGSALLRLATLGLASLKLASLCRPLASRTAKLRVAALGCAWPNRDVPGARCLAFVAGPPAACTPRRACTGFHRPAAGPVSPRPCALGHAGGA